MDYKITIKTDNGQEVTALAPVIISASRSTDIPAFYSKWLINRIKNNYIVWYNPFNQQPMYVAFSYCKVIVFWTKNPKPLIPYLQELDAKGISYYFQYTINDYEKEKLEPNVPTLQQRINTFKELSTKIGKEKVIWRFDPIIVSQQLTTQEILTRIKNIGNQLKWYTNKLVFSFIDIEPYKKVKNNLVKESSLFSKESIAYAELTLQQKNEVAEGLHKLREEWKNEGWDISLATCAEEIDLSQYNIEHNRCIDGELMKQIFSYDKELLYYLNYGELPPKDTLFSINTNVPLNPNKLKDKGQRKACGCMVSKDIGMYNTCRHLCVYCYANTSKNIVMKNVKLHRVDCESIIPPQKDTISK